jgi:hypothetical protein
MITIRIMKGCLLLILATLIGCGPTAVQIQGEIAYYEMLATIQKNQAKTPIFTMIATDATKPIILENVAKIEVYAQPTDNKAIAQYTHKDFGEPFWRFMGTAVMVAAPIASAGIVLHEATKLVGGSSNFYTNNVGPNSTGNFRVQGNTSATSSGGGAATATGMSDATSTPTVMEPSVHVLEPSVHIVEQPAPIIVTP